MCIVHLGLPERLLLRYSHRRMPVGAVPHPQLPAHPQLRVHSRNPRRPARRYHRGVRSSGSQREGAGAGKLPLELPVLLGRAKGFRCSWVEEPVRKRFFAPAGR